jgi:hypothetical protein
VDYLGIGDRNVDEKIDSLTFPAVFSGAKPMLVYTSDATPSIKESQP